VIEIIPILPRIIPMRRQTMGDTEEAAKVLDCAWRGCVYEGIMNINTAYGMAIKVLRESALRESALRGWVKTADRLPTEADAGPQGKIVAMYRDGEEIIYPWERVVDHSTYFTYWLPLPKLPEVEG
jgi:hypothetical protein